VFAFFIAAFRRSFLYNADMQLPLSLPAPGPDALAASAALQDLILAEIEAQQGWISFARYMELALYAPRYGYYSGGAVKLGKDGDFTTAPEMTPLFGAALASAIAPLLSQTAPQIMEFGAGSGRLAHDILSECKASGVRSSAILSWICPANCVQGKKNC
jgi:hypothetical protein